MTENQADVADKDLKKEQHRKLVFYTVDLMFWPHHSEEHVARYDFAGSEIMVAFVDDPYATGIVIEIGTEIPPDRLKELCTTLSLMFSSDKRNNIDFRRGLLLCEDEIRGNKWKESAVLLKDGTFESFDLPHK